VLRVVEPNTVLANENGLIDIKYFRHVLGFCASHYLQTFYEIPVWFAILTTATLASAPWLRWRFSLRTLLIATTLVAVVLSLIVWSLH
jgi:hypothetical protein